MSKDNDYYTDELNISDEDSFHQKRKPRLLVNLAIPILLYMQLGFYVATIMTIANSSDNSFLSSLFFSIFTLLPSLIVFSLLFTSKNKIIKIISYITLFLIIVQIDMLMGSQGELSISHMIEKYNNNKNVEQFLMESKKVINTQDKIFETRLGDYYYKDNRVTEITKELAYNTVTDVTIDQSDELTFKKPVLIYEGIEMYDIYTGGVIEVENILTNTTPRIINPRAIKLTGYPKFAINSSVIVNDTMKIELTNKLKATKDGHNIICSNLDNLDKKLEIDSRSLSYKFYDENDNLLLSVGNNYDSAKDNNVIHSLLLNTKDKNDTSMSFKDYPIPISKPGKYKLIITSYSSLISGYIPVADPIYFVNE